MAEEKVFTTDCRTGEIIHTKADAMCIMEENPTVDLKLFSSRRTKEVYSKKVKYLKTKGWVLLKNLKKGDINRADYVKGLEVSKKQMYTDM